MKMYVGSVAPSGNERFAIVTMCYRGAKFLPLLFKNIQACRNNHLIEWIIVDDGSDDNGRTHAELQSIVVAAAFPVKVIMMSRDQGGGALVGRALEQTLAQYTMILDQDDFLLPGTLDIFDEIVRKYEHIEDFAGACGRCIDTRGQLIGTYVGKYEFLDTEPRVRHLRRIEGEMWQCTRTAILRGFYPKIKKGMTAGFVWNRIAQSYRYAYTSEIVRVYDMSNSDSISHRRKLVGLSAQREQIVEYVRHNAGYLARDPKMYVLLQAQLSRYGAHLRDLLPPSGLKLRETAGYLMCLPIGVAKAAIDRYTGRV